MPGADGVGILLILNLVVLLLRTQVALLSSHRDLGLLDPRFACEPTVQCVAQGTIRVGEEHRRAGKFRAVCPDPRGNRAAGCWTMDDDRPHQDPRCAWREMAP